MALALTGKHAHIRSSCSTRYRAAAARLRPFFGAAGLVSLTDRQHGSFVPRPGRTLAAATMTAPEQISQNKQFGGYNCRYKHHSSVLGCAMTFTVYYPPAAEAGSKVPVLYFLSGLTCTDENFIQKSGKCICR